MAIHGELSQSLNKGTEEDNEMDVVNDGTSEPESESGSEEDDEVKLTEPSKKAIYNRDGLLEKLDDIAWPENVDWIHKLSIDIEVDEGVDVNDDLTRELSFYKQALMGSREGYENVESMGLPFLRPPDYYAEMVKSDTHMVKVKSRLLAEKRRMEEADERRKARESKRIAKEVQAQKLKDRSKTKKDEFESVKKWRKQRQKSGFSGKGEVGLPFEDGNAFGGSKKARPGVGAGDRSGGKGKKWMHNKAKDRESRDTKYGFGGRKGLKKQNTADSTHEFRGLSKGLGKKRKD